MRGFVALALAAAVVACGDSSPLEATVGDFEIAVDSDPAKLTIRSRETGLELRTLRGGSGGDGSPNVFAAQRRATATFEHQFGSFKIDEPDAEPWSGVKRLTDIAVTAGITATTVVDGGARGSLAITSGGPGHLVIELAAGEGNRASFALRCAEGEHFIGFGGQSFDVDHRGQTVPLWVSEDGISKVTDDEFTGPWPLIGRRHSTHTPMPVYLSSRGYAILVDTPARSIFEMCSVDEDAIRIEVWEPTARIHLFVGADPVAIVERLTAEVGRPRLPPAFAFAPWIDAIFGSDNVRRVAADLRTLDIPVSVIWTEDWRGGADNSTGYALFENWLIDRALYPDFETVASDLHDAGYKLLTYHNTFLDDTADVFAEADASGFAVQSPEGGTYLFNGVRFNPSGLVDLSNPDAAAWTADIYRQGLLAGADGWMADFGEWLPADAALASGESAELAHNLYPVELARLNRELFDELEASDGVERLFFMRSAYLGSQSLVSVMWAGDQQTDFSIGDGLPSVIPIGIGLGVAGFPYFGHDIAGYTGELTAPSTKELFFRWVTLGALSPVMRTHHGRKARDNWSWEADAETTDHFRRWARFHARLLPYLYAMADRGARAGTPMMRPVALGYPGFEPGWTRTDQYMLGDRLIVAPVVTEGAVDREVELPPGRFYRIDQRGAIEGGAAFVAAAPVGEIPVFVPAGTALVMLPPEIDTAVATTDPGTVSLEDVADDREVWVWPGGASELTEVGGLRYRWDAGDLEAAPTAATFNGTAAAIVDDGGDPTVELSGPGTLEVDGGATLVIEGGAADRRVVVRFRR